MPDLVTHPQYKVGDKVRLKYGTPFVGTVTAAQGTYSQSGHVFYRVHVPRSPEPLWLEVCEDEVEKA